MAESFVGTTNLGNVNISGDTNITGNVTNIESTNLKIKDNIITLNSEETSNKVSAGKAGIEINRGSSSNYNIVFDETDTKFKIGLDNDLKSVATIEYVDEAIQTAISNIVNGDEVAY